VNTASAATTVKPKLSGNHCITRAVEIKELSVPLSKMDDLKTFYRIIATDERNTAVLKPTVGGVEGM
jgi:hypothetical protein